MSDILNRVKKNWWARKAIQKRKHNLDPQCGYSSCHLCYKPDDGPEESREEVSPTFDYSILTDPREED